MCISFYFFSCLFLGEGGRRGAEEGGWQSNEHSCCMCLLLRRHQRGPCGCDPCRYHLGYRLSGPLYILFSFSYGLVILPLSRLSVSVKFRVLPLLVVMLLLLRRSALLLKCKPARGHRTKFFGKRDSEQQVFMPKERLL